MKIKFICLALLAAVLSSGCKVSSYSWRSTVPENMRIIAVPTFENESGFPELGSVVTRCILREVQREGTFRVGDLDSCKVKLIGKLIKPEMYGLSYNRNYSSRTSEYRYRLTAEIMLVEKESGKILIDGKKVSVSTTFLTRDDMLTGMRDAYPRVGVDLARKIMDEIQNCWQGE